MCHVPLCITVESASSIPKVQDVHINESGHIVSNSVIFLLGQWYKVIKLCICVTCTTFMLFYNCSIYLDVCTLYPAKHFGYNL